MCYWDIIQRSCQDHPKVTQGQNGKNNINIHFFAFLSPFSTADIYAYYGLGPFPEYNYFLWLIIDDNGKYIQKLSDGILSGAKLKVEGNFKVKYDFATSKGRKKCKTSFSCNFDWQIYFCYYCYDSRSKVNFKFK